MNEIAEENSSHHETLADEDKLEFEDPSVKSQRAQGLMYDYKEKRNTVRHKNEDHISVQEGGRMSSIEPESVKFKNDFERHNSTQKQSVQFDTLSKQVRKITQIIKPKEQKITKDDITQEGNRKMALYSTSNFISYIVMIFLIIVISTLGSILSSDNNDDDDGSSTDNINFFQLQPTPISIKTQFAYTLWITVFFFQLLFVIIPLPCSNSGQHFKNILIYKIKGAFIF